jgi:zinc transporter, ZIP family
VSDFEPLVGWGVVIAASVVAGAVLAAALRLPARVAALVSSFAGGVLLAAVAFELVPDAEERAGLWLTALGLLAGTLIYVGADVWLSRNDEMGVIRRLGHAAAAGRPLEMPPGSGAARGEAIAAGLVVDGVPESIALGLTVAEGEVGLALLAGILVGNTVEAYGAAQPIIAGGRSKRFALGLLAAIGAALAVATVLGGALLSEGSEALVGSGEAIAAGALLAVISISIVPYAFAEVSSLVATATVLGFVGGYLLS